MNVYSFEVARSSRASRRKLGLTHKALAFNKINMRIYNIFR